MQGKSMRHKRNKTNLLKAVSEVPVVNKTCSGGLANHSIKNFKQPSSPPAGRGTPGAVGGYSFLKQGVPREVLFRREVLG